MRSKLFLIIILIFSFIFWVGCKTTGTEEDKPKEEVKKVETAKEEPKKEEPKEEPKKEEPKPEPKKEEPKPSAALQKITICLCWQTQCQFAGFYAALENGFYKEEGLDVTLKPGGPDVRPFQEVTEGRVQFGTGQAQEVLMARDKGTPIQCVATNFQTGALRLVAKKSLGITDAMDLKGKKISLWFGGYEYQCLGLLEKYGISKEEVTFEKQGWTMDDFCEGKVDVASVMVYNELNILYEKGVKDIDVISYAGYGINFPEDTIFALEDYIRKNPEIVSKILKASYRGWQWAMEHPKETVAIVIKYNPKLNQEHETNMLREVFKLMVDANTKQFGLGYCHKPDWINMAKILFQQKLLKEIPDVDKAINPDYIDKLKMLPPANMPAF